MLFGKFSCAVASALNISPRRYDNYTSCKKSQQHIEKKLGNYANKLNSKSFSKKKDLEQKAAEWNNGLDEAGTWGCIGILDEKQWHRLDTIITA